MDRVISPLKSPDVGPDVGHLQDALRRLWESGRVFQAQVAPNSPTLEELQKLFEALKKERERARFGEATAQLVFVFQLQQGLGDGLRDAGVEEKTAAKLNEWLARLAPEPPAAQFIVQGQVEFADRSAAAGAEVRAWDVDLRSRQPLGAQPQVQADADGHYVIPYSAAQFASAEKGFADLLVEARQDESFTWTASRIHFNAQPVETVNLTLSGKSREESEFLRVITQVTPVMGKLSFAEITEDGEFQDVTFICGETALERPLIVALAGSARCAQQAAAIEHEEFYGLLRQELPAELAGLLRLDSESLRRVLDRSSRNLIVRPMSDKDLDAFVVRINELKAANALRPASDGEAASLGDFLAVALDNTEQHGFIANLYAAHGGATDGFWTAVATSGGMEPRQVDALRQTLAFGDATGGHLPLVRAMNDLGRRDAAFTELQGFAQWDASDWRKLLQRPRDADDPRSAPIGFPAGESSIEDYARKLDEHVAREFPTAVLASRLGRDSTEANPFGETRTDLLRFFSNNPSFSFAETLLPQFLAEDADTRLRDIDDPAALRKELATMQRLFNVSRRYEDMRRFRADGIESATSMLHLGKRKFIERYKEQLGGQADAEEVYLGAERSHAIALNMFMSRSNAFNSPTPYVIFGDAIARARSSMRPEVAAHLKYSVPDYTTLFGSLDLCECEHCLSLYSPAAYFVDVLRFLGDGYPYLERTPLQVLLEGTWGEGRRADLEHIELTCENTHTELPYVDLTNELLEAAVVPRAFEIPELAGFSAALTALRAGQMSSWLQSALAQQHYEVSSDASVRPDVANGTTSTTRWMVLDRSWAFTVHYQGTNEGFRIWPWPQTSWSSAQLMATPEHVHQPAYDVLRAAVYPWHLPFNLPLEEVRGYLRHLGVERHRLMEAFFAGAPTDAILDRAVAIEYLGFSGQEADLVSGATAGGPGTNSGPWDFWGLQQTANDIVDRAHGMAPHALGDWDAVLQRVSIFLQQSGLSYRELLELLGTFYVNPEASAGTPGGRVLGIVSTDTSDQATCDLSQLAIRVIDQQVTDTAQALQAAWKRIPRFVRLVRRLGWTWRDLDKALAQETRGANGEVSVDDALLKKLSHIERVRARTGLPVITLLAWWGNIDTRSYVDHLSSEPTTVDSLFTQLFSNKTVAGQSVGSNPGSLTGALLEKSAAIGAALQLGSAEFTALQAGITNDGALNLGNLSLFYRHATLARTLKLEIRAYLAAIELMDATPFASPAATLQFIQKADRIEASRFRIEELDYLLRNQHSAAARIGPDDATLAAVLDALRGDLRKVAAENTFTAAGADDNAATVDPTGELTRRKLALLNWDPVIIEQAISVLNDTRRYQVNLVALAQGIVFPDSLTARISYDATARRLSFVGTMSAAELAQLNGLPNVDAAFTDAIGDLFRAPKAFARRYLARYSVPVYAISIASQNLRQLLATLKFPDTLKERVFYDGSSQTWCSSGPLTEDLRAVLAGLSTNNDYQVALGVLFDAPLAASNAPAAADVFLTSTGANNDVDWLFDNPALQPPARFLRLLARLMPQLLKALSESAVKQRLTDYLGLDTASAHGLLTRWVRPQIADAPHPEYRALADFLDPAFASASSNLVTRSELFPRQFSALRLQFNIALLVQKFRMSSRQLRWLFEANPGWLDLNALPLGTTPPATSLYPGWESLADLMQLRDLLPRGEILLDAVFAAARANGAQLGDVLQLLSEATQWDVTELRYLCGAGAFNLPVSAFVSEAPMLRLAGAFRVLKRLGASATQCVAWTTRTPTADDSGEAKSLVRARYDDEQWLDLAKGLRDPLRERQRSALVGYLVQKFGARDSSQLFEFLLIDVEMSPCMTTTRIRQAMNSAQLFIQRSLMNLEPEVRLSEADARQWTQWRKWYRVWEANRKVLFYPENWVRPELRDDKSPFYTDLEGELLQNALTSDIAEDAFLHYLEKLDQVALLDMVGVYRQRDPKDILHVIGRTADDPHIHFYRRLEDKVWSAWEKVDLDIDSDHLIPVVWNRRLYLFWAVFAEKSEMPDTKQRAQDQDPNRYWEIKLAWSTYRNGSWSPRKLSKPFLRRNLYPFLPGDEVKEPPVVVAQDVRDFSFKSRILPTSDGGQLSIECYGPIVERVTLAPAPPPPPAPVITRQPAASFTPHTVFDIGKWRDVPTSTFIKCRVLVGNRPPNASERATMTIGIRASNNALRETLALNTNGNAYSSLSYTSTHMVELVSSAFDFESVAEDGSWWMPFNPGGFIGFLVGYGFDAVADAQTALGLPDIGQVTKDAVIGAAIAAAVATGPNPATILAAAVTALTVVSAPAATYFSGACATVLDRGFGRGFTIKVKVRVPPPAPKPPEPIIVPTPRTMQSVGEFTLDDAHGQIVARQMLQAGSTLHPTTLTAFPSTRIQAMQHVETTGEHALVNPPPLGRGDYILTTTPGEFRLLLPHQDAEFTFDSPFFFQDSRRNYFISTGDDMLRFAAAFHPRAGEFARALSHDGVRGLLTLENQLVDDGGATFVFRYSPTPLYLAPDFAPRENVDFDYGGAYSLYNWELFFHVPLLIALQLSQNQRFEEAQKWFHYIFDPTRTTSPAKGGDAGTERFWRVKPFYEETLRGVQTLESLLADANNLRTQVDAWADDPFRPHVIARMRVVAYMKSVVMCYLDNLIAWGDQAFRRDTMESINEATQLYVLAAQILGPRPQGVPPRARARLQTFRTLEDVSPTGMLDQLSSAVVEIENFIPPSVPADAGTGLSGGSLLMPFFCIPSNDTLLGYWDTVADRLFNIRHCMNIDGAERALPPFEPPIDPGLLVRAVAAGVDIASALNDIDAALPQYRFSFMMQKARELANEVKSLGAALLSALEKKDAEQLSLLRSGHEIAVLKSMRDTRQNQIVEARNTLEGLQRYQEIVTARQQFYLSRQFMNEAELTHLALSRAAFIPMGMQAGAETLAAVLHLIPDAKLGFFTTAGTTYGGSNIASGIQAFGGASGTAAAILNATASISATIGSYDRRQEDWSHQADLATRELRQVDRQLAAAQIRLAMAEHDLEHHDLQIANAQEVDEVQRRKFTNQELYTWQSGQLSSLYFQSYQLAFDVARRAERTFRHELGLRDSSFIQFGYWDSLKKGLLSGDRLHGDLMRMDAAYLDRNRREYEIVKHVSLITLDPLSLIRLKETGECFLSLPEALFDMDHPGHYMRRIKTVSLTIPCVTGPYASVNCTLTLHNASIRTASTLLNGNYARQNDDTRFTEQFGALQSIVTSGAQNDSGLFESNLRDDRYLPFEGLGAISTWHIRLPRQFEAFDYNTISDVVLHLSYTARSGGELLGGVASMELATAVNQLVQSSGARGFTRAFSMRHEFPTEWSRFRSTPDTAASQQLQVTLSPDRFPLQFRGRSLAITRADLLLKFSDLNDPTRFTADNAKPTPLGDYQDDAVWLEVNLSAPNATAATDVELASIDTFMEGMPHGIANYQTPAALGSWKLEITSAAVEAIPLSLRYQVSVNGVTKWRLRPDVVDDMLVVVRYSV
jgi:hypothetical protein